MRPQGLLLPRRTIRAHHKSKDGCLNCKRRKVKCDKSRPRCANCSRFQLPCSLATGDAAGATGATGGAPSPAAASPTSDNATQPQPDQGPAALTRRGRGRPRKDWAAVSETPPDKIPTTAPHSGPEIATPVFPDTAVDVDQAELLHHFITSTGPSLAGTDEPDDPVARFWSHNAPRIGLSVPSVLHLSLSLAAYHLAYLQSDSPAARSRYITLAEHYLSVGLTKANEGLSAISASNCGGLYVSTVLVCFCTFAAGPTGPSDLLACDIGSTHPSQWLPLARGARLLQQLYGNDALFTGLTEPLGPASKQPDDPRPTCVCQGFPRVDWVDSIERLRKLVISDSSPDRDMYTCSFETLASIYQATFGYDDGHFECPERYKMVLIWLYMMEDPYVASLQRMEPLALILLAYFAPLVKTMKRAWFMEGWAEHLLSALQTLVSRGHVDFLKWPMEAVKLVQGDIGNGGQESRNDI